MKLYLISGIKIEKARYPVICLSSWKTSIINYRYDLLQMFLNEIGRILNRTGPLFEQEVFEGCLVRIAMNLKMAKGIDFQSLIE